MKPSGIPLAMRDAFLAELHRRMAVRSDLFFLSADFGSPRLDAIREDYPDRFVNVGIAEQNLINISLGLALEGFCVFAFAIAPFLSMRCFEQIRVDLAIHAPQRPINVNLLGVGAGMSYDVSGPTHHCLEDLSILRTLPGLEIHSPADAPTAVALVDGALARAVPKYFRMDGKPLPSLAEQVAPEEVHRGFRVLRQGHWLILATGFMVHRALAVASGFAPGTVGVVDLFGIRPFDEAALIAQLRQARGILTLEEGFIGAGGLDASIGQLLRQAGTHIPLDCMGVVGGYLFDQGGREVLHAQAGLALSDISARLSAVIRRWDPAASLEHPHEP